MHAAVQLDTVLCWSKDHSASAKFSACAGAASSHNYNPTWHCRLRGQRLRYPEAPPDAPTRSQGRYRATVTAHSTTQQRPSRLVLSKQPKSASATSAQNMQPELCVSKRKCNSHHANFIFIPAQQSPRLWGFCHSLIPTPGSNWCSSTCCILQQGCSCCRFCFSHSVLRGVCSVPGMCGGLSRSLCTA